MSHEKTPTHRKTPRPKIVVLNDDPALAEAVKDALEENGAYEVEVRLSRSVEDLDALDADILLMDASPDELTQSFNFLQRVRLHRATAMLPIIVSTMTLKSLEPAVLRERHVHVMVKPFTIADLLTAVESALGVSSHTRKDNPESR